MKLTNLIIGLFARPTGKTAEIPQAAHLPSTGKANAGAVEGETQAGICCKQTMAQLGNALDAAAESLRRRLAQAEPAFIDLGHRLASLHERAGQLTDLTTQALEGLGSSDDEGILGQLTESTEAATSALQAGQDRLGANLEPLGRMVELLAKLERLTATIKSVAKALKMVGLNLNVECARSTTSQEMFNVLVTQIKALSAEVDQVAMAIAADADQARRDLSLVQTETANGLDHLKGLSGVAAIAVQDTMAQIGQLMALSRQAMDASRTGASDIGLQVGQVVMGIQVHDSLSQRVAHIGHALTDARELALRNHIADLAGAGALVSLQVAQLKDVIAEIQTVGDRTYEAFNQLHHSVCTVAGGLGQNPAAATGALSLAAHHNPTATLQRALGQIQDLLDQGQHAVDRMSRATADANTTVARLADHMAHVKKINFDIHLKALNAIIHAERLGTEGRAIEVLVQEMKELATRSNGFVADVLALIASITETGQELETRIAAGSDVDLGDQLAQALAGFDQTCHRFNGASCQALSLSQELTADILATRDGMHFMAALAKDLEPDLAVLEKTRTGLEAYGVPDQALPVEVQSLLTRYTMDSERHVHAAVFVDTLAPQAGAPAAACDADLGDNVELF